jgi:hypothetical protein
VTRLAEKISQLNPMLAPSASSMSPFLHVRMLIAADEHSAGDANAAIRLALRIEQAVVVDDDVAADVNLVRVPQHDVLAEDDVLAAGPSSTDNTSSAARVRARPAGCASA